METIFRAIVYLIVNDLEVNNMEEDPVKKSIGKYLFFFSGQMLSFLGSIIVQFTILWWITIETQSAIMLSIASALMFLPQVLIMPFAGVISDRWNRKSIMMTADGLQALLTLFLFFSFQFGFINISFVLVMYTCRSLLQAFHWPAYNAVIPTMIPKEHLSRINGTNFLFTGLIQIIGPMVAATMYAFFELKYIFLLDVVTFITAVIPLILTKVPKPIRSETTEKKPSMFKEFKIGLKETLAIPGLLSLIMYAMLCNFFTRPYTVLMPYFIGIVHLGTAFDLALVMGFMQAGNIIGAIISTVKKEWKHKIAETMIFSIIVFIGYAAVIFAPPGNFVFMGVSLFFVGLMFPIMITIYMTILQTSVAQDKVGRITSIDHMLSMLITPIASIIAGPLSELIGLQALYIASAIGGIAVILGIWIFTDVRKLDHLEKPQPITAAFIEPEIPEEVKV